MMEKYVKRIAEELTKIRKHLEKTNNTDCGNPEGSD